MLNILHINEIAPKAGVSRVDATAAATETVETVIKRNNRSQSGRTSANAIYDQARGIYFRAQSARLAKPISIF